MCFDLVNINGTSTPMSYFECVSWNSYHQYYSPQIFQWKRHFDLYEATLLNFAVIEGFCLFFYFSQFLITRLPDKLMLRVFSYLSHVELCTIARVCKQWRRLAYDSTLWQSLNLRQEYGGIFVSCVYSNTCPSSLLLSLKTVQYLFILDIPVDCSRCDCSCTISCSIWRHKPMKLHSGLRF